MSVAAIAVLAVVGGATIAALFWPLLGLLAYLWMDFMRPHDSLIELRSLRPMLILGLVTLASTVWHERRRLLELDRRLLPLLILAAVVASSLIGSVDRSRSADTLLHLGKMLVLVWLLGRLVRDERDVRAVLWVVVLSLGVLAVGAIAEATARGIWTGYRPGLVIEGPTGLGDGPFRDNNNLARVLALSLPLWWVLAVLRGPPWSRWLAASGLLLTVVAITATFSRSGFIALLAGSAAIASVYRPYWRAALLWVGFVAALLLLAPAPYRARVASLGAAKPDASVQGRLDVWSAALQGLKDSPLLGQGAGTFRFPEAAPVRRSSHNIFFEVVAELGLVGLAAYTWLLGAALLRLHRQRRAAPPGHWAGYFAAALQASLLAYLVAGLALSAPFSAPLFVLIGLSLVLDHCDANAEAPTATV